MTLQQHLKARSEFGLSDADHVYMIPQSIFKMHPDYDHVLLDLLQKDPVVCDTACSKCLVLNVRACVQGKIVFVAEFYNGWGDIVMNRMTRAGMTEEACVMH